MDSKEIFAKRLKQARQKAGFSMDMLSEKTGKEVSKQTISKYEAGKTMAGSQVLIKLAHALNVPTDYFFKPYSFDVSNIEVSFRKKASVGSKDQTVLKLRIQDEVERFIDIEKILGLESERFQFAIPAGLSLPMQMIMLAQQVRQKWELGTAPIPSVKNLLMNHGVKVFDIEGPDGFDGISGYANNNTPLMVINANMPNTERRRFTHMHELAHLIANSCFDEGLSNHDKEKLCDAFASEMLLPSKVIEHEFGHKSRISIQELKGLQEVYGISIDAIVYSLKRLGIISDKRHRDFCIKKNTLPMLKATIERSRYTEPSSDKSYNEAYYRSLVYSALAQELISISKAARLLNCSVAEVESKSYAF
jgi:Zn-dependent peptidase ImmA (M78 family)/transcriptional regulator with XRE-family HTH domain